MNRPPSSGSVRNIFEFGSWYRKTRCEFSFIEKLPLFFYLKKIERMKDVTFMMKCQHEYCPRSLQVPAVQGLPEAHPGGDEPVRPRHGHRAREHRVQLRHAGGHGHLPTQGRQGRQIRHQGQSPLISYPPFPHPSNVCSILVKLIKISSVGDP
jgi:hypothetical protein